MATKELATTDQLAELRDLFPEERGGNAIILPRIGFVSQDKTEGRGKTLKVVTEAGTFLDEYETDEVSEETGKKVWAKDELGKEIEVTIVYKRRQLRWYDEANEKYASTPVFDTDEEVMPLFYDGKEVARGTARELQAKYMTGKTNRRGTQVSDLEENTILYVLHNGTVKQMNLRGSSMWNFKAYARKTHVPVVLTRLASEERENGSVVWNPMTFTVARELNRDEVQTVLETVRDMKATIADIKSQYVSEDAAPAHPLAAEFEDDDLPTFKVVKG